MINFHPDVRERLEALAEVVEIHGSGAIKSNENFSYSVANAETDLRFYQGYKREAQEIDIESGIYDDPNSIAYIPPTDITFGWGRLIQHDLQIRITGPNRVFSTPEVGHHFRSKELEQYRLQPGELQVIKRNYIVPTIPMCILQAIYRRVFIPNLDLSSMRSRVANFRKRVKAPGVYERLGNVRVRHAQGGIELYNAGSPTGSKPTIEPIKYT